MECAEALAGSAWLMRTKAVKAVEYGDTNEQLKIAWGPSIYLMSLLCASMALVHLRLTFAPTAHHRLSIDDLGVAL